MTGLNSGLGGVGLNSGLGGVGLNSGLGGVGLNSGLGGVGLQGAGLGLGNGLGSGLGGGWVYYCNISLKYLKSFILCRISHIFNRSKNKIYIAYCAVF